MFDIAQRRSRQPPAPTNLAPGVRAVHAAIGARRLNIASGTPEVVTGDVGYAVSAAGAALNPTTTAGRRVDCDAPNSTSFTIITVIVPASVTGTQMILALDSTAGPAVRRFQLRSNGTALEFIRFNTVPSAFIATASAALSIGRPTTVVAVTDGSAASIHTDATAAPGTVTITGTPTSWDSGLAVGATWFERMSNGTANEHGSHLSLLRVVLPYALTSEQAAAVARNPWGALFEPRRILVPVATAGGATTVAVGIVTETDTAQTVAAAQRRVVGQAVETDSAQALAAAQARAIGLAIESDAALALTSAQRRVIGLVAETDAAQAISAGAAKAIGLITEADQSLPLAIAGGIPVGQAAESDLARPVAALSGTAVGQAAEADAALVIAAAQRRQVGIAIEADSSLALSARQFVGAGLAVEVDSAFALSAMLRAGIGVAAETDSAQGIVIGGASATPSSTHWRFDVPTKSWRFDVPGIAGAWRYDVPTLLAP